jgi:hypothetical protein
MCADWQLLNINRSGMREIKAFFDLCEMWRRRRSRRREWRDYI